MMQAEDLVLNISRFAMKLFSSIIQNKPIIYLHNYVSLFYDI